MDDPVESLGRCILHFLVLTCLFVAMFAGIAFVKTLIERKRLPAPKNTTL